MLVHPSDKYSLNIYLVAGVLYERKNLAGKKGCANSYSRPSVPRWSVFQDIKWLQSLLRWGQEGSNDKACCNSRLFQCSLMIPHLCTRILGDTVLFRDINNNQKLLVRPRKRNEKPPTQTKKRASSSKGPLRINCWNLVTSASPVQLALLLAFQVSRDSNHAMHTQYSQIAPGCPEICMEAKDQNAFSSK